jgi:voltage-gated potassium channel
MNSFQEIQRQLRIAIIAIMFVVVVGVLGFHAIEQLSLLDSLWLTIITLATIGYGDIYAKTEGGRLFTILLVLGGLSVFAFGLQAAATFLVSPAIRDLRQKRRTQRLIDELEQHYIIIGVGEMVDRTIAYIRQRAEMRKKYEREQIYKPVDRFLDSIFGDDEHGHYLPMRRALRSIFMFFTRLFKRGKTLLDVVVVITTDASYAERLRSSGLLAVEGEPTDDEVLKRAGIERALAMMVMLDDDTQGIFVTLTARSLNADIYITTAVLEEDLAAKVTLVGANSVIAPFDVAGNFLNNVTLRPAVNDFFNSILFDQASVHATTELHLSAGSKWLGQHLGILRLREKFYAAIIGIRLQDGHFVYAPNDDYILKEHEILLAVAPPSYIGRLRRACFEGVTNRDHTPERQRLPITPAPIPTSQRLYSLEEAEEAVKQMSNHFVICGTDRVARNAVNKLNPERPFVLISDDESYTEEMLARGFRVIHGNPTQEKTLVRAGVNRAQAMMVANINKADIVLTILISRALSKRLLITATASSDDLIPKLRRAGADRVVSPFHIAAQFVLLATTAPAINDFMQYVLFNYQVGLETTELYMEDDSPWIGETVEALRLDRLFRAGVIGIRGANGSYVYAPPTDYKIGEHEVLIVTTPMIHSDELRLAAHGSATKRPRTLRGYDTLKSGILSRSALTELLQEEAED